MYFSQHTSPRHKYNHDSDERYRWDQFQSNFFQLHNQYNTNSQSKSNQI